MYHNQIIRNAIVQCNSFPNIYGMSENIMNLVSRRESFRTLKTNRLTAIYILLTNSRNLYSYRYLKDGNIHKKLIELNSFFELVYTSLNTATHKNILIHNLQFK